MPKTLIAAAGIVTMTAPAMGQGYYRYYDSTMGGPIDDNNALLNPNPFGLYPQSQYVPQPPQLSAPQPTCGLGGACGPVGGGYGGGYGCIPGVRC